MEVIANSYNLTESTFVIILQSRRSLFRHGYCYTYNEVWHRTEAPRSIRGSPGPEANNICLCHTALSSKAPRPGYYEPHPAQLLQAAMNVTTQQLIDLQYQTVSLWVLLSLLFTSYAAWSSPP